MALSKSDLTMIASVTGDVIRDALIAARVEIAVQTLDAVNEVRAEMGLRTKQALGAKPRVRVPVGHRR